MKRIIFLSKMYSESRSTVEDILNRFETDGKIIYQARNIIKVFPAPNGRLWNVKRYHVPSTVNRFVYTCFRQPKGFRAFTYPERILAAGFETPTPIAYVEERCVGLIHFSYFFSEQCLYTHNFYEFGNTPVNECREILTAFAAFTAGLHKAGILHRDYSPGNILFDKIDQKWCFSIVDINRMKFCDVVGVEEGCANFARLWGQPEWFCFLAHEYAHFRNADTDYCERLVMEARRRFWIPFSRKHKIEYNLRY